MISILHRAAVAALLAAAAVADASAQRYEIDLSQLDPAMVMAVGGDVLGRAPDGAIDQLFQAVHATSRVPEESAVLCALFDPDADRSVVAFQRAADGLGVDSRERFAAALTQIAVTGLQSQPQPYDPAMAQQVLKSSAVKAAMLHDGFMAGMTGTGTDADSRDARCRSFRWIVGVLNDAPVPHRAAATRWLLQEGLTLVAGQR